MQIKAHYQEGRKSPWEARWWLNGRIRTRFFTTERERDRFIREFSRQIAEHGTDVFTIDKARIRRWMEADELTGMADPVEMAHLWQREHGKTVSKTFYQAVAAYLEHMATSGRTKAYIGHAKKSLHRFAAEYGVQAVDVISADQIQDYLKQLPFQLVTIQHERSYLSSAFKWFYRQEWVA